jgi:hypothetical protein
MLSAIDLGMPSDLAAGLVGEFCGLSDFATPARVKAMVQMVSRTVKLRNLIQFPPGFGEDTEAAAGSRMRR